MRIEEIEKNLKSINWDFSDYNSAKYPLDINSIPWYPATFIPPIPKMLIALLTKPGDIVLDPFGGKGTTSIEAIRQGRYSIYNDLNPFATEIASSLLKAIRICLDDENFLDEEECLLNKININDDNLQNIAIKYNISFDVFGWYEKNTLKELFSIIELMYSERSKSDTIFQIRKLAVASILKSASSQSGHFTYVTDNCKPANLIYRNAKKLYLNKIKQIVLSSRDFIRQFDFSQQNVALSELIDKSIVHSGNAENLGWIKDESINLVLTSPPYLCSQDYIKTMRLTNMFFQNLEGFNETPKQEIGARRKRRSKSEDVVNAFYSSMHNVFNNVERILVKDGFFCLVIGQGRAKIINNYNTIEYLCNDIENNFGFTKICQVTRNIGSRVIRVGGVDKEDIIVFKKSK